MEHLFLKSGNEKQLEQYRYADILEEDKISAQIIALDSLGLDYIQKIDQTISEQYAQKIEKNQLPFDKNKDAIDPFKDEKPRSVGHDLITEKENRVSHEQNSKNKLKDFSPKYAVLFQKRWKKENHCLKWTIHMKI